MEDNSTVPSTEGTSIIDVFVKIFSWSLVFGLSASVDVNVLQDRFKEKAIVVGLVCQFFLFPLVGFICVLFFNLTTVNAIVLLILVSSPGGSYSNLWCSAWNADLALSVAMTTVSTLCSLFMLPLNIALYVNFAYPTVKGIRACPANITEITDGCEPEGDTQNWRHLGMSLAIVISAVLTGILFGTKAGRRLKSLANTFGNFCGVLSILLSGFVSSDSDTPPWEQPMSVIFACLCPLLIGLISAVFVSSFFKLDKAKRTSVGIETAYQSVTIALLYAVSLDSEEGNAAAGLTIIYGSWEIFVFTIFCLTSWQLGWTYSPSRRIRDLPMILLYHFQPDGQGFIYHNDEKIAVLEGGDIRFLTGTTSKVSPGQDDASNSDTAKDDASKSDTAKSGEAE